MQRVGSNRNPAVDKFGAGKNGFTAGDPQTGVQATTPGAELFDALQEEIARTIEGAGIALDPTKYDQLLTAIKLLTRQDPATYAAATGTANAITVDYAPAISELVDSMGVLRFAAVHNNTGAVTFSPNELPAKPVLGLAALPLQGGEIVAGGRCLVMYSQALDAWLLLASTGGALQVADATASHHAITFGQLQAMSLFPAGLPLDWPGITPPLWAVVRDGSALSRATYAALFAALCPQRSGTLTSGAGTVTGLPTTLDMWVGMPVEGVGVPAGTTVASITSASAITLSANATTSGVQSLRLFPFGYGNGGGNATFGVQDDRGLYYKAYDSGRGYEKSTLTANTTSASNVLTGIASTRGLHVGMPVSGAGIPASTTISEIVSAVSVKLSANATATGSAVALTVTGRQVGAEGVDEVKSHIHRAPMSGSSYSAGAYFAESASQTNPTGNATHATGGPENNVKRRIYLPIITLGA